MKRVIAVIALVSACSTNTEDEKSLYVGYDEGGVIGERAKEIQRLNKEGKQIIIGKNAFCLSACTMYLGADNVCVEPDAYLGFHGATAKTEADSLYWTKFVASYYPPKLREWFYNSGASELKVAWKGLSGSEVADMGVSLCK